VKKKLTALFAGVFIVAASALLAAHDATAAGRETDLLFVQTAGQAVITQDSTNPTHYILTLKNVSPEVAFFSDSPNRITGKTTLQVFVDEWGSGKNSFKTSSPNASIVTRVSSSPATEATRENSVVLSNPTYNPRTKTLTYMVEDINGTATIETGTHQSPVLFIDGICFICS